MTEKKTGDEAYVVSVEVSFPDKKSYDEFLQTDKLLESFGMDLKSLFGRIIFNLYQQFSVLLPKKKP